MQRPNRQPCRPPPRGWCISPTAHGVYLRDGSCHRLHPVELVPGITSRYLRAVKTSADAAAEQLAVFDLTYIAPALTEELPRTHQRDVDGLVMYELRALYPTGTDLLRAVAGATTARGSIVGEPAAVTTGATA